MIDVVLFLAFVYFCLWFAWQSLLFGIHVVETITKLVVDAFKKFSKKTNKSMKRVGDYANRINK